MVICTKKCHTDAERIVDSSSRIFWDKDGKKGAADPKTSMSVLLDWLTEDENYKKYRGKNNKGVRKSDVCQQIADKINATGVVQIRTGPDVRKKISDIERKMRSALDWKYSRTGAGLMISAIEGERQSFHSSLLKKCKYFDLLEEFFCDRVSGNPKFTSCSSQGTNTTNIFGARGVVNRQSNSDSVEGDGNDQDDEDGEDEGGDDASDDRNMNMNNGDDDDDEDNNATAEARAAQNVAANQPSTPVSRLNALTLHRNASTSDLSKSEASGKRKSNLRKSNSDDRKKERASAVGPQRLIESFVARIQTGHDDEKEYKRAKMESFKADEKYKARLIQQMDLQDQKNGVDLERANVALERAKMDTQMARMKYYKELRDNEFSFETIAAQFPDMVAYFPQVERMKFNNSDLDDSEEDIYS